MKRWWLGWRRRGDALTPGVDPGVSFSWPRDTDLTREQIEIAMRESAASPSQPDAGPLPVETTASVAPRPQEWRPEVVEALAERAHIAWSGWARWMIAQWSPEAVARWERQIATPYADLSETEKMSDRVEARIYLEVINQALESLPRPQSNAADWIERAQPGSTPVLGGIVGTQDADGSSVVFNDDVLMYGHGETPGAAMRDYAESREKMPAIEYGGWPTMPMRSLSNDNYDRVWIAQGDHIEAMGVGDTPQEAAIEYARAVADLLRPTGGPDALDSKTAIRAQLAACRGECGDGPPTWEEWAR